MSVYASATARQGPSDFRQSQLFPPQAQVFEAPTGNTLGYRKGRRAGIRPVPSNRGMGRSCLRAAEGNSPRDAFRAFHHKLSSATNPSHFDLGREEEP